MTLPSVYEVRRWRVTWVRRPAGVRLSAVLAACVELPPAFYPIRRVTGMLSLAQWPTAKTAAGSSRQPARPDA
jgi:hypothetical protein